MGESHLDITHLLLGNDEEPGAGLGAVDRAIRLASQGEVVWLQHGGCRRAAIVPADVAQAGSWHLEDESAERIRLARGKQAAYLAWQQETTRMLPEITRDPVAFAVYSLAERVWAELNARIGEAEQRAGEMERRYDEVTMMLGKLRDRASELERQNRSLRMSVQEVTMGDDW